MKQFYVLTHHLISSENKDEAMSQQEYKTTEDKQQKSENKEK